MCEGALGGRGEVLSRVYLIGSLRNPAIPEIAALLRSEGHPTFDDWYASGPGADDAWTTYEQNRGRTFGEALVSPAAQHTFRFDRDWLRWADVGVMVLPAGKSGHLELGWMAGQGKQTYVLLDKEPERFDVMYAFFDGVFTERQSLIEALKGN